MKENLVKAAGEEEESIKCSSSVVYEASASSGSREGMLEKHLRLHERWLHRTCDASEMGEDREVPLTE